MTTNTNLQVIPPQQTLRITEGSGVHLHFKVSLDNGTVIDSTFSRAEPVQLTIGDGNLLAGFEKVLMNLQAGDVRSARLDAEQAFGAWNPDNVQHFSMAQFANTGVQPEIGMMMEFADKGNNTLAGVITEVDTAGVTVDFNHPLAGQPVNFRVHIIKVLPKNATPLKIM